MSAHGTMVVYRLMRLRRSTWWLAPVIALGVASVVPVSAHGRTAPDDGCQFRDSSLVHGPRGSRDIALTFDACPTTRKPGFAPEIIETLIREATPATFFVSGRWAESHAHELERLAAVPFFETALHGYQHHKLNGASADTIFAEIDDGRSALWRLGARPQMLFRPPFGDQPHALADSALRAGVTPVLWDVAPGDPDPHETAADIERDVLRRVRGGSIIVLHVNGRGVGTAAALPNLLGRLKQRGFRFVTVSQLFSECAERKAPR